MKKSYSLVILIFLFFSGKSIGQHTILWKVSDTTTNRHSYFVGTFHQFGNSFVDSIPELRKALLNAELAIFESVDEAGNAIELVNSRQPSDEIAHHLSKKDLAKLKELSANWEVDLYKLRPIELGWKLQQEFQKVQCKTVLLTDEWDHFDRYLIHLAKENNIELFGLETDSLQLKLISDEYQSPTWKNEKKRISYWLDKLTTEKLNEADCAFADQYRKFELDYEFSEDCPENVLLKQRNATWMDLLPDLLASKNCFVAVGLFHLKHRCGLLEQLKEKGFLVEPVEIQKSR